MNCAPAQAEAPIQGGESFFHETLAFSSASTSFDVSAASGRGFPSEETSAIGTFCDVNAQFMTRRGLRGSSGSRNARESTAK